MVIARIWFACIAAALAACAYESRPGDTDHLLFGPATENMLGPLTASNLAASRKGDLSTAYPRKVNRLAIDSGIVVAEIDGKQYRFLGTIRIGGGHPPMDFWNGQTSSGDRAEIIRMSDNMFGKFVVAGRSFGFSGEGQYVVFWESAAPRPLTSDEVAVQEKSNAEADRLRETLRNMPQKVPTREEECAAMPAHLRRVEGFLRMPQPPHMRLFLEEVVAGSRARQAELGC